MSSKQSLRGVVLALLAAAACSGFDDGSVTASAEVQRQGVHAYSLSPESVTLLAGDGSTVGVLRVTAPDPATRLVDIDYQDGLRSSNEISRPSGGRFRAPVLETREGFILGDPALASFFAAHDLQFAVEREVAAPDDRLAKTSFDLCHDITWAAVCTQCPQKSLHPCTYTHIPGGKVARGYAYCPPKPPNDCITDIVSKIRTCYTDGSCTQHALGFITCGFDEPNACGLSDDSD